MTLGVTFKSLTQKNIESEKKLNASVVNAVNNATEAKQQSQKVNEQVQEINQMITDMERDYVSTTMFENYKTEVNQKLFGIYTIKGNVANYEALLELQNNAVGDVYNVLDTGANYVYTDEDMWDKLSETIDISNFVDIETFNKLVARVEALEKNGEGGTIDG